MGLDLTHGAYSAFHRWRCYVAEVAGYGDLNQYEGYNGDKPTLQIDNPGLRVLFEHSDCDGELTPVECESVAKDLADLLPLMDGDLGGHIGDVKAKTQRFIDGCLLAHSKNETLYFG